MQLVLSKNRIIAHGENFLAMGGVVINTETGARYENATVAECDGCPSDIDKVGYEYHAGVFVPCAPYGVGNNNGCFMEVCESCATPRNSGIPIKQGLKAENMHPDFRPSQVGGMDISLLWENENPASVFKSQSVSLLSDDYTFLLIELASYVKNYSSFKYMTSLVPLTQVGGLIQASTAGTSNAPTGTYNTRYAKPNGASVSFDVDYNIDSSGSTSIGSGYACIPIKIYGVKL